MSSLLTVTGIRRLLIRNLKVLTFFTACIIFWVFQRHQQPPTPSGTPLTYSTSSSLKNVHINSLTHPIHQQLKDVYGEEILKFPLSKRCRVYFDELFKSDPNWQLAEKLGVEEFPHTSTEIIGDLHHLNIFNHCFVENYQETKDQYKILLHNHPDFESRVYPYLSKKFPIYERWNGDVFYDGYLKFDGQDGQIKHQYSNNIQAQAESAPMDKPFWSSFNNTISGSGIVISSSDKFLPEVLKLMKNLRALGNVLPVQIVYRGDLSLSSKQQIVEYARTEKGVTENKQLIDQMVSDKKDYPFLNLEFPPQDIWFVEIEHCLSDAYKGNFQTYYNKLLAYIFNSFENTIMLDSDSVLFKPPSYIFNTKAFKNTQTLFFKDRNVIFTMSNLYQEFLKSVSPQNIDQAMFNMKPVNPQIFKLWDYFSNNNFHYMESGVLAINRIKYYTGVINIPQLSLTQSFRTSSWGDKELFWKSLLISGHDKFHFNKYWASSAGEIDPFSKGQNWRRICSAHPAHIDEQSDELFWINSGVSNCPSRDKIDFDNDWNFWKTTKKISNVKELADFYHEPVKIRQAIMPPENHDTDYQLEDITQLKTVIDVGFRLTSLCNTRYWCAYNTVGNSNGEENVDKWTGKEWEWSKIQTNWIDYVVNIYNED
ncbi:putative alpha-1,3-mannosyltransferase [Martiniozyma asiatica (nom. inval.)]|nr:putative alpha-1,3-mannosyltransferase [Martiniozyma asiatica]